MISDAVRSDVVQAILDYLAEHGGLASLLEINRALPERSDSADPWSAELAYLERQGRIRRTGHGFWLVSD